LTIKFVFYSDSFERRFPFCTLLVKRAETPNPRKKMTVRLGLEAEFPDFWARITLRSRTFLHGFFNYLKNFIERYPGPWGPVFTRSWNRERGWNPLGGRFPFGKQPGNNSLTISGEPPGRAPPRGGTLRSRHSQGGGFSPRRSGKNRNSSTEWPTGGGKERFPRIGTFWGGGGF